MKTFGKLSLGALALLMAACSSDEPIVPDTPGQDQTVSGSKDVYASLRLRLPSAGTRAWNEDGTYKNDGEEIGKDRENNVGKVLVILATRVEDGNGYTYKYLTKAMSDSKPTGMNEAAGTVDYLLNFSSEEMKPNPLEKDPYSTIPGTEEVYVFAYCNPSEQLQTMTQNLKQGDEFTDIIGSIEQNYGDVKIWEDNKFLMTNCYIAKAPYGIPDRSTLVKDHNTPEKALPLGEVYVKRAAARFDFQTTGEGDMLNRYVITDLDGETPVGTVHLTQMAMFNIAKEFYYIPRTAEDWTWTGKHTICGDLERFVVSPNKSNKLNLANLTGTNGMFWRPLANADLNSSSWNWVDLDTWNTREEDNHAGGWTVSEGTDYRIWRYVTENTIPAATGANGATSSQKAGITTGVVFKAEFEPNASHQAIWNGNTVYMYNNIVYGDLKELQEYAAKSPDTAVAKAVKEANLNEIELTEANLKNNFATDENGFTGYKATDGKYIMYYFYYNRHNTNGVNTQMGENEFGVVRNNVYKLKVNSVGSYGRPTPPDPDTDDEEEHAYFKVSCIVMPWTVRINNIDF